MKETFDAKFIENIVNSDNSEFTESMQGKILNLLAVSINELSSKVPFITLDNTILQPLNETFNGAFTPMSKYIYFLGINSPQMEMNNLSRHFSFKKFWKKFVQAWHDSKKRKSKRRRRKEEAESHKYEEFEPEKYDFEAFRHDLQLAIAQNLSETSIVYNTSDRLIIQGKDDFGSIAQIEIIPVIFDGDIYKYFISKRKGYLKVNINERFANYNEKYKRVGENFFLVLKIFNNLFKNLTKESVNQIFVESLLYNIPDELYKGKDIYSVFKNIVNYLNMTDVSDFVSIENKSEKLFKSKVTSNSAIIYAKFIRNI